MPALTRIGGVLVQLVEIPGLIEGATEDRGGGRALLGVLRTRRRDRLLLSRRRRPGRARGRHRAEVAAAGIDKPAILAATRADEAAAGRDRPAARRLPGPRTSSRSRSSTKRRSTRSAPRSGRLTGLIRVWLRKDGAIDDGAARARPGSTVADVADWVHHDLAASFSGARVWGPSARFDGQRVGRDHQVSDGDVVEIFV